MTVLYRGMMLVSGSTMYFRERPPTLWRRILNLFGPAEITQIDVLKDGKTLMITKLRKYEPYFMEGDPVDAGLDNPSQITPNQAGS